MFTLSLLVFNLFRLVFAVISNYGGLDIFNRTDYQKMMFFTQMFHLILKKISVRICYVLTLILFH